MEIELRPCGDCTVCCSGALIGDAYGNKFGHGNPCIFLVENKCTIYQTRPDVCRNYQCAWSQGLLPEWMKPSQCGVLISVETEGGNQYLKVISQNNQALTPEIINYLDEWTKENKTYYRIANEN